MAIKHLMSISIKIEKHLSDKQNIDKETFKDKNNCEKSEDDELTEYLLDKITQWQVVISVKIMLCLVTSRRWLRRILNMALLTTMTTLTSRMINKSWSEFYFWIRLIKHYTNNNAACWIVLD